MLLPVHYRSRRFALTALALVCITFTAVALVGGRQYAYLGGDRPIMAAFNYHGPMSEGELGNCERHGLSPHAIDAGRPRRIYDLFMVSTELDWLKIRLNTLAPHVDYFVIVEGDRTFTGHPKPLYLQEHWEEFAEFHDKIVYAMVPDPGGEIGGSAWDHEAYLRNAMLRHTFPNMTGTEREARDGDVLIVSDVDEIPKPETITTLRDCSFPDRLTLRSNFYYYSFQWRHIGVEWQHPQATVFRGMEDTILPNDLRLGIGGPRTSWVPFLSWWRRRAQMANMWNAAWHCSSCFETLKEMRTKMSSFSHTSLNTQNNRDTEVIVSRVRHGLDLFGRGGENYERVEPNRDVPEYILHHADQYRYLLDRDGVDAGFTDWTADSTQLGNDSIVN